jgi:hypothetical protein
MLVVETGRKSQATLAKLWRTLQRAAANFFSRRAELSAVADSGTLKRALVY